MAREPPEQVIKVPFKTNNSFNSTMMASFLPLILSKKNKQTKKNMSFIAVYHINPEKTPKKHQKWQNDVFGRSRTRRSLVLYPPSD